MTVTSQTTKVTATGNGSATTFSFSPLVIFASTDLVVVTTVTATGVETTRTEGTGATNWSTSLTSFPATGSIVYPADTATPLPSSQTITIKRVLTLEQQTDLENQGTYFADTQETQFDKLLMIDLQQQEIIDRSFSFPLSYTGSASAEIPAPVANAYLLWDAAGTSLTTSSTSAAQFLGGNGTALLPFYSYSSDPNSGAWRVGADQLGWSVNGVKGLDLSTTGLTVTGTLAATAITGSGVLSIDNTTESTSGTSGSIHTDGGLGVAKKLHVIGTTTHGGNVVSDTDSTDDLGTTGVRWANLFVDGITATDQITATGFTGTLDGILGSGAAAAASVTTLTTSGIASIDDTTESTSGTSGSIHTDGGLGVAKKLHVIGTTTHGGDVLSDTDSTDSLGSTGVRWLKLWVDSIQTTANTDIAGDLTVTGNLTVNGTTVTNDATNTEIKDPLIELNSGATSNANDLGLLMERGSTGDNVFMGWDESGDYFGFGTTTATADTTGNITYSLAQARFAGLNLSGTSADLGAVTTIDINGGTVDGAVIGGAAAAAGTFTDLASTGDTTIGNATGDGLTINPAAWTLANAVTVTGTWTNLGAVTTADINGGTVDGAVIGGASAAAITGTALTANTSITLATGGAMTGVLDSDTMSGTSAALLSTSESIKAYVDNNAPENGVKFAWESTTTDTDQGAGKVWGNNGTHSSISVLYVDDVEAGGVSVNSWVDTWDDVSNSVARGYIYIASYGITNAILVYKVTGSVTSASTYSKIAVSHILTVGTISDGDSIGLTFVPSGSDGAGSGDLEASNNLSDVASAATAFANIKQAASASATGVVELATDAETNTGSATDRVVTPANLTQRAMLQGLHSMWISAGSMIPQITNGPSSGLFESSSNDIMSRTLDFNTSTDELAQFTVVMPKSWNEGTVTFRAYWTAASGSGTVLWSYAGGSFADSLALDTALGSEAVTAADTLLTALDVHVSAISAACTIANSPAAGGLVIIRVRRDVSGDNLGVDAKLLGVQMFYTADAGNDA